MLQTYSGAGIAPTSNPHQCPPSGQQMPILNGQPISTSCHRGPADFSAGAFKASSTQWKYPAQFVPLDAKNPKHLKKIAQAQRNGLREAENKAKEHGQNYTRPENPFCDQFEKNAIARKVELKENDFVTQAWDKTSEALYQTLDTTKNIFEVAKNLFSRVEQTLSGINLPVAGAATEEDQTNRPVGLGGLLIYEFKFDPSEVPQDEVSSATEVIPTLKGFAGENGVYTLKADSKTHYPFLHNVVSEAPNGMVVTGTTDNDMQTKLLVEKLVNFFDATERPYDVLETKINLSNIEWVPESDLLVIADSTYDPKGRLLITPSMKNELKRVFDKPKHLVHIELNSEVTNKHIAPLCYDLDVAFLATTNPNGEKIALIHKPCIMNTPKNNKLMGRAQFLTLLKRLGYQIIEVSEEDQRNLILNAVTLDNKPGKILFSSKVMSDDLRSKLKQHGLTPVFPKGKKVLGHPNHDFINGYGVRCMTTTLNLPQSQAEDSRNDENKNSKDEL